MPPRSLLYYIAPKSAMAMLYFMVLTPIAEYLIDNP